MSEKRNLPSWLNTGESSANKPPSVQLLKAPKLSNFSNLLEGVVFVLSGFVNPERSVLRSQALEMGADYDPDWRPDSSTLLICAFPNTPKFRQVQADCGTIVSKEWISECYSKKKLVDIETYLMNAGKPWRKGNDSVEKTTKKPNTSPPRRSLKQNEAQHSKPTSSVAQKNKSTSPIKSHFAPSKVKKWAIDDLKNTLSWLESQEEKPESSEIKKIAAEGILTCLQDAIDSLEQNQDVSKITEQWNFVPRVVDELAKLDEEKENGSTISKKDLFEQAKECKRVYETEFDSFNNRIIDTSLSKNKKPTINNNNNNNRKRDGKGIQSNSGDDSDETIEMTEDEIDFAYNNVSSKLHSH